MIAKASTARSWQGILLSLIGGLLIAGCHRIPVEPRGTNDSVLSGKLALEIDNRRESGSFVWHQTGKSIRITLMDPFGRIVATIHGGDRTLDVAIADRYEEHAPPLESLRRYLPIGMMSDWLYGRPSPSTPFTQTRGEGGMPKVIRQNGWVIEYLAFHGDKPRKIRLSRDTVNLLLVISDWHVPEKLSPAPEKE